MRTMEFNLRFLPNFRRNFFQFADDFLREKIVEQFLVRHLRSLLFLSRHNYE